MVLASTPILQRPPRGITEIVLSASAAEAVRLHAAGAYPMRACGLLLGRPDGGLRVTRALPCPNIAAADERRHRFVIDPRAVLNVRRALRGTGQAVLGIYHSRPDGEALLTAADMEHVEPWPGMVWLAVPAGRTQAGRLRSWWLRESGGAAVREIEVRYVEPDRTSPMTCPE